MFNFQTQMIPANRVAQMLQPGDKIVWLKPHNYGMFRQKGIVEAVTKTKNGVVRGAKIKLRYKNKQTGEVFFDPTPMGVSLARLERFDWTDEPLKF